MANKTLNVRHKQKIDTASNWTTNNPVLLAGELGFETDTNKFKLGDGTTAWNSLPYAVAGSSLPNNVAYFEDASFANMSWATINEFASDTSLVKTFNVGDEKTIELSNGETVILVILGISHDDLTAGGKAGLTIGMKDCLATTYPMNNASSPVSWENSTMRTTTLPYIFSLLPEDLQSVIKYVDKTTAGEETSGGSTTYVPVVTSDRLFLLARKEIFGVATGTIWDAVVDEGTQYAYWAEHDTNNDRIKTYDNNGISTASQWWTRSVAGGGNEYYYWFVTTSGTWDWWLSTDTNERISFAFCI